MQKVLNARFKFVTDSLNSDFDSIYITATYLTPAYRGILDAFQTEQAKDFLLDLMKEDHDHETDNVIDDHLQKDTPNRRDCDETEEPPTKRFKHLHRVSELLQHKEREEEDADSQELTNEEEEIERYSNCKASTEELQLDPMIYWVNVSSRYPLLSPVACDILSTPASLAPIERTFSVSGEASKGRRNRLMDYNLERETMLRKNKSYL